MKCNRLKELKVKNVPSLKIQRTIWALSAVTATFISSQSWWILWVHECCPCRTFTWEKESQLNDSSNIYTKWNFDDCFHSPVISLHFLVRKLLQKYAEWRNGITTSKASESGFKSDYVSIFTIPQVEIMFIISITPWNFTSVMSINNQWWHFTITNFVIIKSTIKDQCFNSQVRN